MSLHGFEHEIAELTDERDRLAAENGRLRNLLYAATHRHRGGRNLCVDCGTPVQAPDTLCAACPPFEAPEER